MGLERRKKSNRDFGGSKLNVPGQGIFTVERSPNDKIHIHKQIGRIPRPTKTPTITQGETPTPTPTPTITPTVTPTITPTITPTVTPTISITPSITPTITPSVTCERPSGLTYTIALYEYDSNYFTTGLTSSCEALADYNITSGSSSGFGYGINTLNSPIQIGDYVYSGFSFDTDCSTIPDGYYIVTTPSSYIIQVSGGTVISLPNCEIDPLSLGQPLLYYSSYYPSFLSPSPFSSGDPINDLYRVSDSGYTATTLSATCQPYWNVFSGDSMLYFPIISSADPCFNSYYYVDNSTPLDFMFHSGYQYTIYVVVKPEAVDYQTAIFSTENIGPAQLRGINLWIDYSWSAAGDYRIRYQSRYGVGPSTNNIFNIDIETSPNSTSFNSKNLRVISIRAQDPGDLITNAATVYINNTQVISTPQLNISTDTFESAGDLRIAGQIALVQSQYTGYLADFIIFNTIHDETTHFWVTEYLKTRWNIT